MSVPLPLMIVVYVIGTIVAIIIIETIYTIAKSIINEMKHKGFDNDYFKLTNKLSIFLNKRIHSLNKSEINYILYEYGFDNAITNYKKKYKIIDIINTHMLLYNLIYNNYFVIINLDKFEAAKTINSYIIANRDRHLYIKKLNIKKEEKYLIEKINKEIVGDDAKYILNNIVEKFINKSINSIK
jgi:hypothetical protein